MTSRTDVGGRLLAVARAHDQAPRQLAPFSRVLEDHGPALLRFCFAQAGRQHGEDVFQETMLAALRAYGTVRDPDAVKPWLFSIGARKAIDTHRAAARTPVPVAEPDVPVATPAPDDSAIWDDVARLPEKQRRAIGLRFLADLSHREIAETMQISEAAARRNVFEGVKRLRADLAPPHRPLNPSAITDREKTP